MPSVFWLLKAKNPEWNPRFVAWCEKFNLKVEVRRRGFWGWLQRKWNRFGSI